MIKKDLKKAKQLLIEAQQELCRNLNISGPNCTKQILELDAKLQLPKNEIVSEWRKLRTNYLHIRKKFLSEKLKIPLEMSKNHVFKNKLGNERGEFNEQRVLRILSNSNKFDLVRARTPEEDALGIDIVCLKDNESIYLQIKSSYREVKRFCKKNRGNELQIIPIHVSDFMADEHILKKIELKINEIISFNSKRN